MSVLINASTSTGLVQSADTSGEIELQSNGTTALKVNTNEGIQILNCLGVGNATPSTSGAGITFPATQSASSDANTLDDYEEGTWTPVAKLGATSQAAANTYATYTKIGRVVYIQMTVTGITKSGTGDLYVDGLPFTVAASSFGDVQGTIRWGSITSSGVISPYFSAGGTTIALQNFGSSGFTAQINNTNCSATYDIYGIEGFYFVS